jgi:hypothetical protein
MKKLYENKNIDPSIRAISFCADNVGRMIGGLGRFASDFLRVVTTVPDYGKRKRRR